MPYVIGAVILVLVLFAFLQMGSSGGHRPRRIDNDRMHDMLNRAEGALLQGKLDEAEGLFSQALSYARGGHVPVHIAESYYGLARIQESRGLNREAVHMVDLAIRAIEPYKADFGNYHSLLTRYKGELSARISN